MGGRDFEQRRWPLTGAADLRNVGRLAEEGWRGRQARLEDSRDSDKDLPGLRISYYSGTRAIAAPPNHAGYTRDFGSHAC